jgi:23S rRNA (cytosine1962-C5)-methyltransferase
VHQVVVNRKAADRIASGHPWIFATDVVDRGEAGPGDAVLVFDPRRRLLGTFHYSSTSQITLRRLSAANETIDRQFFTDRIGHALEFRRRMVSNTDAYRVVYGEADGLPALVVDRYGDCIALQTLNQGMDRAQPEIVAALSELLQPAGIIARNDAAVRRHEQLPQTTEVLAGEIPPAAGIGMNGLRWGVDLTGGQKTGIYLDQRENYLAAARYARGHALDCFTSTGGFALHLARVCDTVEAVDSSEHALAAAAANAGRNAIENIRWREADVFDVLASYAQAGRRFDTVVLDPPAFTKSRGAVESAARGYKEINYRALRLTDSGGVLVTCSCSHHFSEAMLLGTVAAAALDAGRTLRVLERRTQAADHPVLLTVPETLYLKCLILEVV